MPRLSSLIPLGLAAAALCAATVAACRPAVKLTSSITPACGQWIIHRLEYELESSTPNGRWFAIVQAHKPGRQPVVS